MIVPRRRARNGMMLLDILITLFLTHVGNLTTVKSNQRRFAPAPARITGITCPHHRNTQLMSLVLYRVLDGITSSGFSLVLPIQSQEWV